MIIEDTNMKQALRAIVTTQKALEKATRSFESAQSKAIRKAGIKPGAIVQVLMRPYDKDDAPVTMRVAAVEEDWVYCNFIGGPGQHNTVIEKSNWGTRLRDIVKVEKNWKDKEK